MRRGDEAYEIHGLAAEIPRWRLRLVWLLRDLEPEEIAGWSERMRIRRADADVLERAFIVGTRLADRVATFGGSWTFIIIQTLFVIIDGYQGSTGTFGLTASLTTPVDLPPGHYFFASTSPNRRSRRVYSASTRSIC